MLRKAKTNDIDRIRKLINFYADKGQMLPRSLNELYENMRDFFVVEEEGKIAACCALHIGWGDLAEIKSLAVTETWKGKGLGKQLVKSCLEEAKEIGIAKVFALTYSPGFFEKFGFKQIKKEELPHKIWNECTRCPKFPDCDEIPLIKEI